MVIEGNMVEALETLENDFNDIMDQMNKEGREPSKETTKVYREFKKNKEGLEQKLKDFFDANDAHITIYFLHEINRIAFQFETFQVEIEYQRRKNDQGFVVDMYPSVAFLQDAVKEEVFLMVSNFIEGLKSELLSCKNHKLRAVVQEEYVHVDSVGVSEVKLDEEEKKVRALFIEGKGFGDISESLKISREEVKNVLARLKTHNLI